MPICRRPQQALLNEFELKNGKRSIFRIGLTVLAFCLVGTAAWASQVKQLWRQATLFEAASTTAMSITGTISLSKGAGPNELTLKFENGKTVELTRVSQWNDGAEVFSTNGDPGELINGNTLCGGGDTPARYIVFENEEPIADFLLMSMAVFSSQSAPSDMNGADLCATFSYSIEKAQQ